MIETYIIMIINGYGLSKRTDKFMAAMKFDNFISVYNII